ncbi:DUF4279 domain-containing protein [Novosphingobium sp. MD-1]|uniref:DUF4279 domain-containing protein n=1 Tax=Novosphingobium sp. MD-1 TaxID=1630648 RepID=UPI00130DB32C|nr:DUF4279 domain-containing protein [Novosphingobium sp. MD-1]
MTDALQRAIVSLSITEDELDPDEITTLLAAKPQLGVRKGETFTSYDGKQITARTGMWRFGGDWENAPIIGNQIATLFERLTQDLTIWKSVTSRFHCHVSVGGYFRDWTGGLTLEPGALMLLAERGLAIDFDLYAPIASDVKDMS